MALSSNTLQLHSPTLEWEIGKWEEIGSRGLIKSPQFVLFPDHEIYLDVEKQEKHLSVYINRSHEISRLLFHYKVCVIDRQRQERFIKRENSKILRNSFHTCLAEWDLKEVDSIVRNEDQLIIRCTLTVGSGSVKHDCASQTQPVIFTDSELSQDFRALFLAGEDSDMKLKVKGIEYPAHKAILRSRSSVFRVMLQHDMVERNNGIVDINDCDPHCFRDYLLHLYSGKFPEISRDNVIGLHWITDKYDAQGLKAACLYFMLDDLCTDNFCDYTTVALLHDESALLKSAKEFFKKHIKDIVRTVKWKTFNEENPDEATELLIFGLN